MELLMYVINYKMYFHKKPAKADVKNKLFDLLRDDFTLRTAEEEDDYVKRKEIQEKKCL